MPHMETSLHVSVLSAPPQHPASSLLPIPAPQGSALAGGAVCRLHTLNEWGAPPSSPQLPPPPPQLHHHPLA